MAIEYTLSLGSKISEIQNLLIKETSHINTEVGWNKNFRNQDVLNINCHDQGFHIAVIGSLGVAIYQNIKFKIATSITFRFTKEYHDVVLQKKNLLTLILRILSQIKQDVIFDFNGDCLLLYRKDEKIFVNTYFGFWNDENMDLLEEEYNEIYEKEEIAKEIKSLGIKKLSYTKVPYLGA